MSPIIRCFCLLHSFVHSFLKLYRRPGTISVLHRQPTQETRTANKDTIMKFLDTDYRHGTENQGQTKWTQYGTGSPGDPRRLSNRTSVTRRHGPRDPTSNSGRHRNRRRCRHRYPERNRFLRLEYSDRCAVSGRN